MCDAEKRVQIEGGCSGMWDLSKTQEQDRLLKGKIEDWK